MNTYIYNYLIYSFTILYIILLLNLFTFFYLYSLKYIDNRKINIETNSFSAIKNHILKINTFYI